MTQLHYILATFYIDSDSLIISNTFHSVPVFSSALEFGSDFFFEVFILWDAWGRMETSLIISPLLLHVLVD
jgi:hypothetical protein